MEIFRKSLVIFLNSGIFLFKCRGINQMILLKAFFLNDLVACVCACAFNIHRHEYVCVHMHAYFCCLRSSKNQGSEDPAPGIPPN